MIYVDKLEEKIPQLLCTVSTKQMHRSLLISDVEGCWKADVLPFEKVKLAVMLS